MWKEQRAIIFSGDSLLVQASDVLGEAWHDEGYDKEHYLVVPHHGGDNKSKKVYKTYVIPDNLAAKAAIISVDEANNSYGHPSNDMIDYLKSVAKWEILRTDKDDLSGAFNLSRDLLEDIRWEHEERMNEILAEDLFRDNTETQNQNK